MGVGILTQFWGGDDRWSNEKGPQQDLTMLEKRESTRSAIAKNRCIKRENRRKIEMKNGIRCCKMLILVLYLMKIVAQSVKNFRFVK